MCTKVEHLAKRRLLPIRRTGIGRGNLFRTLAIVFLLPFAGCTAIQVASDKLAEKALGAIGVSLPENPNLPRAQQTVSLRVETAEDLNAGEDGQGMSTIFRLYKLRQKNAFLNAPYGVFGNAEKEKVYLSNDLLEVRELVLTPGEKLDLQEKISSDTAFLGIVALYRLPSPQRWRFAFASADSIKQGIRLGLHACAMTATAATPVNVSSGDSTLLSPARCR
jgi:type VI secretion system protein VasD